MWPIRLPIATGRMGGITSGANADIPRRIGMRIRAPRTHQRIPYRAPDPRPAAYPRTVSAEEPAEDCPDERAVEEVIEPAHEEAVGPHDLGHHGHHGHAITLGSGRHHHRHHDAEDNPGN